MKKLRDWFWKSFFIGENLHQIRFRHRVLESQVDFLLKNSNRRMRRRWGRMLTNKKSPFFLSDL